MMHQRKLGLAQTGVIVPCNRCVEPQLNTLYHHSSTLQPTMPLAAKGVCHRAIHLPSSTRSPSHRPAAATQYPSRPTICRASIPTQAPPPRPAPTLGPEQQHPRTPRIHRPSKATSHPARPTPAAAWSRTPATACGCRAPTDRRQASCCNRRSQGSSTAGLRQHPRARKHLSPTQGAKTTRCRTSTAPQGATRFPTTRQTPHTTPRGMYHHIQLVLVVCPSHVFLYSRSMLAHPAPCTLSSAPSSTPSPFSGSPGIQVPPLPACPSPSAPWSTSASWSAQAHRLPTLPWRCAPRAARRCRVCSMRRRGMLPPLRCAETRSLVLGAKQRQTAVRSRQTWSLT